MVGRLESLNVGLISPHESIDTTSRTGKHVCHLFGTLGKFGQNLIRERTGAGLRLHVHEDARVDGQRPWTGASGNW